MSTDSTVAECEINYRQTLAHRGLIDQGDADIDAPHETDALTETAAGFIADIRSAVMDGTTQYFIRLEDGEDYFQLSAADAPLAVLLNAGDYVEISYYPAAGGVAQPAFDVKLPRGTVSSSAPASPVETYTRDTSPETAPAEEDQAEAPRAS